MEPVVTMVTLLHPLRSLVRAAGGNRGPSSPVLLFARLLRPSSTMSPAVPPVLSVVPSRALVDETFRVTVQNLPPGSAVTLHSLHRSDDEDMWEAFGHYVSDQGGSVSGELSSRHTRTHTSTVCVCLFC